MKMESIIIKHIGNKLIAQYLLSLEIRMVLSGFYLNKLNSIIDENSQGLSLRVDDISTPEVKSYLKKISQNNIKIKNDLHTIKSISNSEYALAEYQMDDAYLLITELINVAKENTGLKLEMDLDCDSKLKVLNNRKYIILALFLLFESLSKIQNDHLKGAKEPLKGKISCKEGKKISLTITFSIKNEKELNYNEPSLILAEKIINKKLSGFLSFIEDTFLKNAHLSCKLYY